MFFYDYLCKKWRKHAKDWRHRKKTKSLIIYGKKYQVCGESDIRLLQWHHKNGKPKNERNAHDVERRIVREEKILDDVELLCANHHILANIRDKTSRYYHIGTILYIINWMEGKR
jgi:hypothetical protein